MIRYLLFAGDHFYPGAGVSDLEGQFETPEEAEEAFLALRLVGRDDEEDGDYDWAHVWDIEEACKVFEDVSGMF